MRGTRDCQLGDLEVLADRIACLWIDPPGKTELGIVLPESARDEPRGLALVIAVGPKVEGTAPGDTIAFASGFGHTLRVEVEPGELVDVRIVRAEDVGARFPAT